MTCFVLSVNMNLKNYPTHGMELQCCQRHLDNFPHLNSQMTTVYGGFLAALGQNYLLFGEIRYRDICHYFEINLAKEK